ncbi:MAG: M4 family metallopeptidase [Verrucomicrobiota bacterium]|nr:M4 family metallopeptidase [Verrucomicrobiota bacterium]
MQTDGRRFRPVVAGLVLLVAATWSFAFRGEDQAPEPGAWVAPAPAAFVRPPDAKVRAAAAVPGLRVRWDERTGRPLSVVMSDVAATAKALAVKRLKVAGAGDFRKDAIAVLDNVGKLYDVKDAEREFAPMTDDLDVHGFRHVRVEQRHAGLPVVGGAMVAHFDRAGKPFAVNGSYVPGLAVDTIAALTAEQATAAAQADLQAMGKPEGTTFGKTRLVIFARTKIPALAHELILVYDDAAAGPGRWRYWVDARNGNILSRYNDIQTASASIFGRLLPGEGGAGVTISAELNASVYSMENFIRMWTVRNDGGGRVGEMYNDAIDAGAIAFRHTNNWTIPAPRHEDRAEVSAANNFNAIQTYYSTVHGRSSFDGFNALALARAHVGVNLVNAYWSPTEQNFFFGDGDGTTANSLCVLDVCAHEIQHAVTEHSAGLIYQNESGALNESFSDIFGALVEFNTQPDNRAAYPNITPGTADWLMGEDCWLTSTALRDLRNPKNAATVGAGNEMPTYYQGDYWHFGADDNGGVHRNMSVQCFMFYLLCEGGSGNNEGRDYHVPGIGILDGRLLAYLTLTQYMTADTDYRMAREAWMLAALEMDAAGGYTTHYYVSAWAAWRAVGIGSPDLIEPYADFYSAGRVGVGPFNPTNKTYTIFNPYSVAHTWAIAADYSWVVISPSNVTLPALSRTNVVVSITSLAATLPEGVHTNVARFGNTTMPAKSATRNVILMALDNYHCVSTNFSWVGDANVCRNVVLDDDGVSEALAAPFPINYYFRSFTNFYVSANGMIGFYNEGLDEWNNADIPANSLPNGMLCPFWDDLDPSVTPGMIRWGVTGTEAQSNRQLVVSWTDVAHASDKNARFSFQVVIPERSGVNPSDFVYQYREVGQKHETLGMGMSATVGLEEPYGVLGAKYSRNGSAWLANNQALLFTQLPPPDSARPTGAISVWNWTTSSVTFELRFNEIVTNFTSSDVVMGVSPRSAPYTAVIVRGGGERYLVDVTGITGLGTLVIRLPENVVFDLAGNGNVAIAPFLFVMPTLQTAFEDTMEEGVGLWTRTDKNYEQVRSDAWEYGAPTYALGPPGAYSGTNCWGTVLDGPCDNTPDCVTKAWLTSQPIAVGENPVLSYAVWHDLTNDTDIFVPPPEHPWINWYGRVEVENGHGWLPVATYKGPSGGWLREELWLDNDQFGNRTIKVRFVLWQCAGPGLYVDDVSVFSRKAPGLCVAQVNTAPTPISPIDTVNMDVRLYNSGTVTYSNVSGLVSSLSPGATVNSNSVPVSYGTMLPGQLAWSSGFVQIAMGGIGALTGPRVAMTHDALSGLSSWSDAIYLTVSGMPPSESSNIIAVGCSEGVKNWMGAFLQGDGGQGSSIFQLIGAGPDGTRNPPQFDGMPSGDDRFLHGQGAASAVGLFGEGPGAPADLGQFFKLFKHNLSTNDRVYVRAWDSYSFRDSVAYGDSDLCSITNLPAQTNDFAQWIVNTVIDPNSDYNGDSIPDAWDIEHGLDPRRPVGEPLTSEWIWMSHVGKRGAADGQFTTPARVAVKDPFLFVLDTGNARIQIFNRNDLSFVRSFGSAGTNDSQFSFPGGLALDPRPGIDRIAVADTHNNRIQMFSFDPVTTNLTFLWKVGQPGPMGVGANNDQFMNPEGVAIGYGGNVYVADTGNGAHVLGCRIQVYDSSGAYLRTIGPGHPTGSAGGFMWPRGVCVTTNETVIVADTGNHRIQAFNQFGVFQWQAGTIGNGNLQFNSPRGVQVGRLGRIYVADTLNNRVGVLDASRNYLAAFGTSGFAVGQLNHPYDVWPAADTNLAYVADTFNNRIQAFSVIIDADGDGMNDLWEDLHGLNATDPNDAYGDLDGDGLGNLAEYLLGFNPESIDTDGDGQSDGAEIGIPNDPLSIPLPPDQVALVKLGSGQIVFLWRVYIGARYAVERGADLRNPAGWTRPAGIITASFDGIYVWVDDNPPSSGPCYYRVVRFVP